MPSMSSLLESERLVQIKENYIEQLYKQLTAAYERLVQVVGADQVRVQQEVEKLEKNIKEKEDELRKSKPVGENFNDFSCQWEDSIAQIDFKKATKIFESVLQQFDEREGAAFFLLENSRTMGGKWCVNKLKKFLQYKGGIWSRPYKIGFPSWQQPTPDVFLSRLGEILGVERNSDNLEKYAQKIVDIICQSLEHGSIIFIDLNIYDLSYDNQFLNWFINSFWRFLVGKLSIVRNKCPLVKFLAVVSVGSSVPRNSLSSENYCTKQKFDSEKILKLPLQKWTETEIRTWLKTYSGLYASNVGRTDQEIEQMIEQMAKSVYQVTKGIPIEVYRELTEELTKVFG